MPTSATSSEDEYNSYPHRSHPHHNYPHAHPHAHPHPHSHPPHSTPPHYTAPHPHPASQYPADPPPAVPIGPGVVAFQPPQFEPQPWVYDFISFLAKHTTGIARVDLRRPTLPPADTLGDNVFFTKRSGNRQPKGRGGQFIRQDHPHNQDPYNRPSPPDDTAYTAYQPKDTPQPTGARLKISRHVSICKDTEGGKPLLDFALGLNFDMDTQKLRPVARLKVKDWLAVKAVPLGVVRAGRSFKIGEKLALKVAYEVPIERALRPLAPPARLMVRLDNFAGAGLHLSPVGVEFDQRVIGLGNSVTLRAAGSLLFPRQLPLNPDRDDAFFGWKIHRLGLKAGW